MSDDEQPDQQPADDKQMQEVHEQYPNPPRTDSFDATEEPK
jgi:hypothetical protein